MLGLLYVFLAVVVWWGERRTSRLESWPPLPKERSPRLSIIVTARDEAARIRQALESLLHLDYPAYEVIVVDGGSSDGTDRIIDELANERLRAVHVTQAPPDWLGKSYAMHLGTQRASGEWLLFTDADVQFAPKAVARAMTYALDRHLDHLTVCPTLVTRGVLERIFLSGFLFYFLVCTRPWSARNPRSRGSAGIGAFNLVRADAYHRAGGHAPISLQVGDDLALGVHLKRQGCRQDYLHSDGSLRQRWHEGFFGLLKGLEKNAFWVTRYNVLLTLLAIIGASLISWLPFLGLFVHRIGWFRFSPWSPVLSVASILLLYRLFERITKIPWYYGFLHPLGTFCWCLALANSMWVTLRDRGVRWRDLFYPLDLLKSQRCVVSLRDLF